VVNQDTVYCLLRAILRASKRFSMFLGGLGVGAVRPYRISFWNSELDDTMSFEKFCWMAAAVVRRSRKSLQSRYS